MKISASITLFGVLLALTILSCIVTVQAQDRRAYALQSRGGNEGISIVVNVNINPHRKKRSAEAFPVDDTTKNVVASFKEALSSKEEREVAETYLEFANKIKGIADKLDQVQTTESNELKQQLLAIVKDFTVKSEHPSVDILQSSLTDISKANENQPLKEEPAQQQQPTPEGVTGPVSFESSSGAKSLWLGQAISIASLGMNIVDGIGTYSDKISKVGKFLSGPVASKLDKWGLKGVSETAKKWGSSVDTFSQTKLKPIETKVAAKIAPVVKSKTFQAVRRTLNVVSGALSLKGGLKALGMVRNIKLPTSYKALKTSLTKATKFVKNRKQVMSAIRKTVSTAGKNWKKMGTVAKLKNANEFRKAYSGFKTGLSRKTYSKPTQKRSNNQSGRNTRNNSGRSSSQRRSSGSSSSKSRSSGSRSSSGRSSGSKSSGNRSGSRSSGNRSSPSSGRSGSRSSKSSSGRSSSSRSSSSKRPPSSGRRGK
ncbi:predicted protein [Naegleria gruberi]|uniref:Predicted protein n=1 Tax=Naegleria gruberi TaxID=5762 RepID=D2VZ39_NAEGR|nr:uncharacterized protein NAEGRDRAFT_53406 [Naegleria gruberi]EFC37924.1 predicted protein [Naegleria gruberi]|eukprot:XP_002670668.1 predicted protein [Naegleria gruberi strain NEG-M]